MLEIVPWPCGTSCKLTEWRCPWECMFRLYHGNNSEHSRDFPYALPAASDFVLTQPPGGHQTSMPKAVIDWLISIHRYESPPETEREV
ncbi:hypothetical protein LCGC14_1337590 [marine sediment metagenome]|uniref:Uncharacterized protein n=1 Tax=marine sediment metagenome TaxID=412755 RepID=A0A0F9MVH4_9ZZZZ